MFAYFISREVIFVNHPLTPSHIYPPPDCYTCFSSKQKMIAKKDLSKHKFYGILSWGVVWHRPYLLASLKLLLSVSLSQAGPPPSYPLNNYVSRRVFRPKLSEYNLLDNRQKIDIGDLTACPHMPSFSLHHEG
jgi:hypothetical protein